MRDFLLGVLILVAVASDKVVLGRLQELWVRVRRRDEAERAAEATAAGAWKRPTMGQRIATRLRSWDGLLLAVVLVVIVLNTVFAPNYLSGSWLQNQVNLWQIGIEKAIVVLAMTFVIINGEIDLSVASVMGLSAVVVAVLWEQGVPIEMAIVVALLAGVALGLFNGFWVAIVGLPSLAVTLAGLIGFRGLAFMLIEDRSIGNAGHRVPAWFEDMGQQPLSDLIGVLARSRSWSACRSPCWSTSACSAGCDRPGRRASVGAPTSSAAARTWPLLGRGRARGTRWPS